MFFISPLGILVEIFYIFYCFNIIIGSELTEKPYFDPIWNNNLP
jgi:hypothetical protein